MSQQNQADVSGNFTEDIEATIDDLFTPVKEIEIDPLTNEIKDRDASAPAEAKAEPVTEEMKSASEPLSDEKISAPAAAEVETEESTQEASENAEDGFLDLELELDVDFGEETGPDDEARGTEGTHSDSPADQGILEQFSETIMSLEWEIKPETINTALTQAETIKQECLHHSGTAIIELIGLMITLLSRMSKEPDLMPSVPTALKNAVDTLQECITNPDNTGAAEEKVQELEQLVQKETAMQEEEAPAEPEIEPEIELEPLTEEAPEEQQETAQQGAEILEEVEPEAEEVASVAGHEEHDALDTEIEPDLSLEKESTVSEEELEMEISQETEPASESTEPGTEDADKAPEEVETPSEDASTGADKAIPVVDNDQETSAQPESVAVPPVHSMAAKEAVSPVSQASVAVTEPVEEEQQAVRAQHEVLKNALEQHIRELEALSAKIIPVENLLAKTQGMEKLHAFQKGIRAALENQKRHLESALQGNSLKESQMEAKEAQPESAPEQKPADAPSDITGTSSAGECPFSSVAVMSAGSAKIAVPAEEIAFAGSISGRFRKKLHKEPEFSLAWLKPWPWIKIKPSLSGALAELEEKELKEMKLPVLNSMISEALGTEDTSGEIKNPVAVILYTSEGKGGVLYVENTPETSELGEKAEWASSSTAGGLVTGELRTETDTMTVISLSKTV
jgi:hypothetical protein